MMNGHLTTKLILLVYLLAVMLNFYGYKEAFAKTSILQSLISKNIFVS